ncbi:SRPBCC family protein [Natronococcus sp. A-GB7]|uniref:SRPBCC family protein n=1 Tax=Natronococcus sp. A-GB7 TaxID=3037649 RepID=UPI00241E29F1|nr:SRPBCC family protein [Natronococcus sp. A-GB7]MDG5817440.1 SRPBCC family protein [Natronococcus sp. A-GB7]
MVTVSETVEIDVDPERAFDYLDDPHNHAEVTPSLSDVRNVKSIEDGSKRLEFTYEMVGVGLDGELVQTIHQPPERHTFAMSGTLEGEIDIELEAHDDGTRLTYTGTYDLPGRVLSKAAEPFVRRYNERELRTTLENLKSRLELSE